MSYNNYNRGYAEPTMTSADYMTRTYRWMALGLLVTFAAAFVTATTPLFYVVNSLYLLFTLAELALVLVLSARVQNMSVGAARGVFLGYALLNGMVLSYYFLAFDLGTLVLAFLATSLYFGLMAVYGTTTHKDLSGWGPKLMMALFALLITGFVGLLFGMGFMGTVLYSGIGLVVFMLLTAYDTQKLSQMYSYYAGDSELAEKASIYGALTLYLDFINIFLYVVRLLGLNSRRRDYAYSAATSLISWKSVRPAGLTDFCSKKNGAGIFSRPHFFKICYFRPTLKASLQPAPRWCAPAPRCCRVCRPEYTAAQAPRPHTAPPP